MPEKRYSITEASKFIGIARQNVWMAIKRGYVKGQRNETNCWTLSHYECIILKNKNQKKKRIRRKKNMEIAIAEPEIP